MSLRPDIVWRNPFPPTPRVPQAFSNLGADLWLVSYQGGQRVWFECVKGGGSLSLRTASELVGAERVSDRLSQPAR